MLEQILDIRNVQKAFKQVTANKGAGGIDGMQTDELRNYLHHHWQSLRTTIVNGSYAPTAVRKVEIPKASGGRRMLGIPTVFDRLLQQSILQWLSPKYEEEFSANSYGFRPKRNAHQAVLKAKGHVNDGFTWIIELDLEKFFDKVNHDKLMHLLARKIGDKRTLKLIRNYLQCGIMDKGLITPRREGTPQGSPLSPLLSNIVLNELDRELERRGHRFVRYADDCSIYLRTEKSAFRVMESIIKYLEIDLKLPVNRQKSKVSSPYASNLLGYTFGGSKTWGWALKIGPQSLMAIKEKIRAQTRRTHSLKLPERIGNLENIIRGWVNYFSLIKATRPMTDLDGFVRTRLRMVIWKKWKTAGNRTRQLIKLGAREHNARGWARTRKGCCRTAHSRALCSYLSNKYFTSQKYVGFANYYLWKTKHQMNLF